MLALRRWQHEAAAAAAAAAVAAAVAALPPPAAPAAAWAHAAETHQSKRKNAETLRVITSIPELTLGDHSHATCSESAWLQ